MALVSGTRRGPYEVLAPIGAAGMGEVALKPAGSLAPSPLQVALNWTELLKK